MNSFMMWMYAFPRLSKETYKIINQELLTLRGCICQLFLCTKPLQRQRCRTTSMCYFSRFVVWLSGASEGGLAWLRLDGLWWPFPRLVVGSLSAEITRWFGHTSLTISRTQTWSLCSIASVMSNSFGTLWTVTHQAPLSMGFFRQEYWSGLPFPSSGGLSHTGIEPASPTASALSGGFFTSEPPGKPACSYGGG